MQVNDDKPYDDINITPMLDLAYVLLVIFILMCTASVQGIKVNLPKSSKSPSLAKPKTIAITINNQGGMAVNTLPVSGLPELEANLQKAKAENAEVPVVVRGDSGTQYQAVMD